MMDECPVWNETVKDALEKDQYYEILMGRGEYWIEDEKYCKRGDYRLLHNRLLVVSEILEWAVWKNDVKGVMERVSAALDRIVDEDPLIVLKTILSYIVTLKDGFRYGPQEEEMGVDFGLDCWRFYDLAKSKEACLDQYHYNEDELRVYHRLLEVLPQYFPSRN